MWRYQATTGDKPPALSGHTLTIVTGKGALFGGYDGGRRHNDTYILDLETWVRVSLYILHFELYLCHVHGRRVGESPKTATTDFKHCICLHIPWTSLHIMTFIKLIHNVLGHLLATGP